METFDAVIVGSGQAAGPLATALATAGWKVLLAEKEHVGGTCINEGCTPTKTMIASGRAAYMANRAAEYGVLTKDVRIDMATVRRRKRDIVDSFRTGSQARIERTPGVELVAGSASFIGPKALAIELRGGGRREVTAPVVVIDTGTRPRPLEVSGAQDVQVLSSTSVMELDVVPEHLVVVGGGYVGVEFAQLFRRLGSQVTLIQHGQQLLPKEDADIAAAVLEIFTEDGIEVLTETKLAGVKSDPRGIAVTVSSNGAERTIAASHILEAAGRLPNTEELDLAAAGLQPDTRGFIPVNDRLETAVEGIFAVGDVNGGPAFTHISYDDFRILRANLLEDGAASTTGRLVPYTVFMDPELGRVGLTESQARREGRAIRVAKMPMTHVARALETDESRGLIKAVIDARTDQILGFAMLGIGGGEIMSLVEVAMMGKLPYTALREAVFAHPTVAESLNNLFANVEP